MIRRTNAETKRPAGVRLRAAAFAASLLVLAPLLLPCPARALGQRGGHAGPPHGARPAYQGNRARRPAPSARPHQPPRGNSQPGEPGRSLQAPGPNSAPEFQGYPRFAAQPPRPDYAGVAGGRQGGPVGSYAFPPGHLGSWLNQHRNLPLQGQEQLLHSDPSFNRLPQQQQQRLVQQLRQVDQMPPQQRARRLARAEAIEHMTPEQRNQLYASSRQLSALPADRQARVKRAFRDLRGVPLDQRQTVIDSNRYRSQFTPEERGILTNLLRAEPYQPPQP